MNQVALVSCMDYESVPESLARGLALLGGLQNTIRPGMKVVVKPNLVMGKAPQVAATTHPAVLEAVVKAVQDLGATVILGDSPGGPFTPARLRSIYDTCGVTDVASRTGAQLNFDTQSIEVSGGEIVKTLKICKFMAEADAIINVGKLKTHGLTGMTACVKNMFGAVPGMTKAEYHYLAPRVSNFCQLLIDIYQAMPATFNVLDAVIGMQGDGPTGGEPRQIGALVLGQSAYAVDEVGAALIGAKEDAAPMLQMAKDRDLVPEYEVLGDAIDSLFVSDYHLLPAAVDARLLRRVPPFMQGVARRLLAAYPVFVGSKCLSCGDCVRACPAKALSIQKGKKPKIQMDQCIGCFCCQELCPHKAVDIHRSPLQRWLK